MSGHSKWAQIKRQKGSEDSKRSKLFAKLSRVISSESKRANGDTSSPSLRTAIEKAKAENMPKDTIDRAIKKGIGSDAGELISVRYEAYGPGGCAFMIEGTTDNKNRTTQEIKHLLSLNGAALAESGAAAWAFQKNGDEWEPTVMVPLSEEDGMKVSAIIEELESHDDIENVYTNAN